MCDGKSSGRGLFCLVFGVGSTKSDLFFKKDHTLPAIHRTEYVRAKVDAVVQVTDAWGLKLETVAS